MKINKKILLLLLCSIFTFFTSEVRAEDKKDVINGMGYIYEIQYPDNQIKGSNVLNLRMNPGQEQQVEVKIRNFSDKKITIRLSASRAGTGGNGEWDFGPNKLKADKTLQYDFTDVVKVPEEVAVPPKGEATFPIAITMPTEEFEGFIAGGIQLQKVVKEENTTSGGVGVNNKFAFLFAVMLSENDQPIETDFKLRKVYPGLSNYRGAFIFDIANAAPRLISGATLEIQVSKDGSKDVLYEVKKSEIRMAPNSLMSYPLSLGGEEMQPGDYMAHVKMTFGDDEFKWDKKFTVSSDEADKFNQEDVGIVQERGMDWKLIALIALAIFIVIVVIIFLYSKIGKNKKNQKEKSKQVGRKKK